VLLHYLVKRCNAKPSSVICCNTAVPDFKQLRLVYRVSLLITHINVALWLTDSLVNLLLNFSNGRLRYDVTLNIFVGPVTTHLLSGSMEGCEGVWSVATSGEWERKTRPAVAFIDFRRISRLLRSVSLLPTFVRSATAVINQAISSQVLATFDCSETGFILMLRSGTFACSAED